MAFVVGFSGSPRNDGNTHFLVREVLAAAAAAGAETRFHDLNETPVRGCQACMACKQAGHEGRCAQDDAFGAMNEDLRRAEGIVLGAPVYMSYWCGQFKNFLDRWYCWTVRGQTHLPPGKRGLMICACGAAGETYQDLLDRLVSGMKRRGLAEARGLMAGGLAGKDAAAHRPELVSAAGELGRWLAGL